MMQLIAAAAIRSCYCGWLLLLLLYTKELMVLSCFSCLHD